MSTRPSTPAAFDGFSDDEVDRFLAGASTAEEAERFRTFMERENVTAAWFEMFRKDEQPAVTALITGKAAALVSGKLGEFPSRPSVDCGEHGASARQETPELQEHSYPRYRGINIQRRHTMRRVHAIWSSAIGALLVIGFVIAGWRYSTSHTRMSEPAHRLVYTTTNGQRATVTLSDGSQVMLNVASRLEVPTDYDRGNRTVRLTGEALFTVAHHEGAPFTVLAGASRTQVLGTSFLVRHYATDSVATVAVRDGKVRVHATVLTEAEQGVVSPEGHVHVRPLDPGEFSFTYGVLTLNDVSLPDAIPELDRWYDADIRLGDQELKNRRASGDCAVGSLADLTAILQWTYHARVVRNGRVLTLYSR